MSLRKYESFFILDPDLPEDAHQSVGEKLRGVIESGGGTVVSYAPWGKKKLAYPVKKKSYGHYVLMEFASGPDLIAELERNMRLDERILKFITVKQDDEFHPEEAKEPEPETAPTQEAEAPETEEAGEEPEEAEGQA
ncbi:small subunit ribosomal protein S6 [Desulfacinum hydrothermale DSM 13146]|uniref:Small ribosomal subunit protein bS6 n=1 Tax=Desulfacinum hydrothermale DSM 13146 TaxID=1121390 RepID=A0A1W1XRM7_9BACT|nr:30S ribosomal protein S6 [Desulfacinum hydrothermale]SMC26556.1 small subunit ribosomal protein S6 [Desulfacinum hydrothermale DSM 13146]